MSNNNKYILNFIAELIHPNLEINHLKYFPAKINFWDKVVEHGSSHLVLPLIYSSIQKKNLVKYVPYDLLNFLKNLSEINYNRNKEILNQINQIVKILKEHKISYVFLKGAAILLHKKYETIHTRMIGDIDLLIDKKDINNAQQILKNEGYFESENVEISFSENIVEFRHLARLVHPRFIAAVELHSQILKKKHSFMLKTETVFERRKNLNGIYVPCSIDIWLHAILNWQYNDRGIKLNYLSFRAVSDVICFEPNNFIRESHMKNKAISNFYSLLSLHIPKYPNNNKFLKKIYELQIDSKILSKSTKKIIKLLELFQKFIDFTKLLINSKLYRKRVIRNKSLLIQKFCDYYSK